LAPQPRRRSKEREVKRITAETRRRGEKPSVSLLVSPRLRVSAVKKLFAFMG